MGSQWEDKSKSHLNIVFVGHVDHGKSTTVGRLLLDSGHIEQHVIDGNEKLAAELGKSPFGNSAYKVFGSLGPKELT